MSNVERNPNLEIGDWVIRVLDFGQGRLREFVADAHEP